MEESQFDVGCQTERPNLPHGRSNIMVSLTSAAPLHVGPRGRDSVHVDFNALGTGTGKKDYSRSNSLLVSSSVTTNGLYLQVGLSC